MEESSAAIQKFVSGDHSLTHHDWILKIATRDMLSSFTFCVAWQLFIVHSSVTATLRPLKFTKDYQHAKHLRREVFYSICTILCGTFWEVVIMILYHTGYVNTWYMDWNKHQLWHAIMVISMPIWRDGHFWWVHRMMHDWETTTIPDIGAWLYKVAHSVHHTSRNIQPMSGISMHPIEGLFYECSTLMPLMFTHHPIMTLFIKIDLNYAAILGHDGHEYPAHGDWFHTIHHLKIKGNYGSANAPFDWLFGTVDYGEDLDLDKQTEKFLQMLEEQDRIEEEADRNAGVKQRAKAK